MGSRGRWVGSGVSVQKLTRSNQKLAVGNGTKHSDRRLYGQLVKGDFGLVGIQNDWGLVGKTGVESRAVVEGFDVVEDGSASLGECGEAVMID